MGEADDPRRQAYIDVLQFGFMLLRNFAADAGDIELCRIEADHLHNIPSLLYEENEGRHEYYIRGERGLFLQRLRERGAAEYLERVRLYYDGPWQVMANAAGYSLPEWDRDA
jgi:hypothetical protein